MPRVLGHKLIFMPKYTIISNTLFICLPLLLLLGLKEDHFHFLELPILSLSTFNCLNSILYAYPIKGS